MFAQGHKTIIRVRHLPSSHRIFSNRETFFEELFPLSQGKSAYWHYILLAVFFMAVMLTIETIYRRFKPYLQVLLNYQLFEIDSQYHDQTMRETSWKPITTIFGSHSLRCDISQSSSTVNDNTNLKPILEKLLSGQNLSMKESEETVATFLTEEQVNEYQIAAFLSLLRAKGETADELAGMALAMRQQCLHIPLPENLTQLVDIVGTGGDGADTVNISTAAAILAAACGAKVAKHGSHSSSSRCGSADVLQALGVKISLSPNAVVQCLQQVGIAFLYAPQYHPSMKNLSRIRKGLRIRTTFNLLGPLTNPAMTPRQVIGVSHEALLEKMATALQLLGTNRSWVFHCCGLDELSPLGDAIVLEVTPREIHRYTISPSKYGFPACEVKDLQGGDATYNAQILRECLQGTPSAISNAIILNAGAALFVSGIAATFADGITMAARTLISGSASELLDRWAHLSQRLK
eukprot:jgi/Galph1/5485/GphlegSOOS_G4186.1